MRPPGHKFLAAIAVLVSGVAGSATAQTPTITVDSLECIPLEQHSIVTAEVADDMPGHTVRLYFRRLHEEVEDFYWVPMHPANGKYWAALPKPENYGLDRHELADNADAAPAQRDSEWEWASWWKAKELSGHRDPNNDLETEIIEERARVGSGKTRDWMLAQDDQRLESWLENLDNEPVEYYAAVYDSSGVLVAASETAVAPVVAARDCPVDFNQQQAGTANNLTIGESAAWQQGRKIFHWLCDGVVTRVDYRDVPRADEVCRACVVGFFAREDYLLPAIAGIGGITTIIIESPPNPSPTSPGPR